MKRILVILIGLFAVGGVGYAAVQHLHGVSIGVFNSVIANKKPSSISGLNCANAQRRPIAVMMPSDPEARPLSGIGQADLVMEMPVTPNGITRFMAVFQCQTPKEVGAIRSARQDFIPQAASFEALYAHWGGEHGALAQLDSHIVDNIDGLKYEGTTFYRKKNIPKPHNGFTTFDRLIAKARELGYDLNQDFSGYPHTTIEPTRNLANIGNTINLTYAGYKGKDRVSWTYDSAKKVYWRSRGGTAEIDRLTGQRVSAKVVAVLQTSSHILNSGDQYVVVNTTGQGSAEIYQNGIVVHGSWQKDPTRLDSKLYFYDANGKEAQFLPGQIWVEWNPTWSGGL